MQRYGVVCVHYHGDAGKVNNMHAYTYGPDKKKHVQYFTKITKGNVYHMQGGIKPVVLNVIDII